MKEALNARMIAIVILIVFLMVVGMLGSNSTRLDLLEKRVAELKLYPCYCERPRDIGATAKP